jgi:hypothetical protein
MKKMLIVYYAVLVSVAVLYIYTSFEVSSKKMSSELADLRLEVSFEFATVSESIVDIRNSQNFRDYISNRDLSAKQDFQKELLESMSTHRNYDQIRYLDKRGMEIIRVGREEDTNEPVIVDKKQDKSSRYYFLDTMKLDEGEMYVSPLDLNVENGEIEEPLKPTIRIANPVFSDDGSRAGIVIINYLAQDIIDRFYHNQNSIQNRSLLFVNSDGYFFKAENPEDEWGFMYKDRLDKKFSLFFPEAWHKILSRDSGIVHTSEGTFIFDKIYPINDVQVLQEKANRNFSYFSRYLSSNDFHMVIIVHQTDRELLSQFKYHLLVFAGLLFAPVGVYILRKIRSE